MAKLAVLLPTYNAAAFLKQSITSILDQTFTDFHLFIFDDASEDNSSDIIIGFKDERIFYKRNPFRFGIAKTLNTGLDEIGSKYEFIARMDADDWSYPDRFEEQLKLFETIPDLAMCGTQGFWTKDFKNLPKKPWTYPTDDNIIRLNLLFTCSFGHSSVMFKGSFLSTHKFRYREDIQTCEDWELWTRIVQKGTVANSPHFLMKYRILPFSNHRNPLTQKRHGNEKASTVTNHWLRLGFQVQENLIKDFFNFENSYADGKDVLEEFINLYNQVHLSSHFKKLSFENQKHFKYQMLRSLLRFSKKANIPFLSRIKIHFEKVNFISKIEIIKGLIS